MPREVARCLSPLLDSGSASYLDGYRTGAAESPNVAEMQVRNLLLVRES